MADGGHGQPFREPPQREVQPQLSAPLRERQAHLLAEQAGKRAMAHPGRGAELGQAARVRTKEREQSRQVGCVRPPCAGLIGDPCARF